ncbi:MAG: DUF421 domain-containing protein [Pseudolabrys sp.]
MSAIANVLDTVLGLSAKHAEDLGTLQMCARALIVYLVLIGYVRFGKKRFLGRATALDAVLIIVIGSLASRAVSGTAPFFGSLAATFVFIALHWIISYFTESSTALSFFVKGHDTVLIRNGKVDRKALKKSHMSSDDLAEDLRQQGVEDPGEVKEARLERSGKVSVIKRK